MSVEKFAGNLMKFSQMAMEKSLPTTDNPWTNFNLIKETSTELKTHSMATGLNEINDQSIENHIILFKINQLDLTQCKSF